MAIEKQYIFNLKFISEKTDIDYFKLYNNRKGNYKSMTEEEKNRVEDLLRKELDIFLTSLYS
jgi:hypothetical protein